MWCTVYLQDHPAQDDTESSESDPTWKPGSSDNSSNSTDGSPSNGMVSDEKPESSVGSTRSMVIQRTTQVKHDMPSQQQDSEASGQTEYEDQTPSKPERTNPTIFSGPLLAILVISAIFISLSLAMWLGFSSDSSDGILSTESQRYANLVEHVEKLEQLFPSQTKRFWKTFTVRTKKHIASPERPLVFMMAVDKQTANTSQCLARHLGQAISGTKPLMIDALKYADENGDQVKLKLDTTMKKYFDVTPDGTVVINHIELLPPLSPFLFYPYCDNDNALYPRSTVIFITHIATTNLSTLDLVRVENVVEQFLGKEVWGHNPPYDPGAVSALLSRITDTVLVPIAESSNEC